jgi:hypothetical protein
MRAVRGVCRERRLELVNGGDYEELTAAVAACRVRIEGLWAVVGEPARREPGLGEWRVGYEGASAVCAFSAATFQARSRPTGSSP